MTTSIVLSISDEQLAELEESFAPFDGQQSMMIKGVIGRLRAAEADAGRLQYLIDTGAIHIYMGSHDSERAAIDAAMESTP